MKLFITGATGFVGRALVLRLQRDGHTVTAWVRNACRARALLGGDVKLVESSLVSLPVHHAIANADAVINLAGEPIVGGRWTKKRRAALVSSRVDLTRDLVDAIAAADRKPAVLISASAVGYYGARGPDPTTEAAPVGDDFLAGLCAAWESEALRARTLGLRVAIPRLGVVLGRGGGALAKMLPPFRAGVGGRLGSGKQPMPWVHLTDVVNAIATAVTHDAYDGPFNAVSPNPVTNREFTERLGDALSRPTFLPVPATVLKLVFGAASTVLLDGQRALPARLSALGFAFSFPHLRDALADITHNRGAVFAAAPNDQPKSSYLQMRRARHSLRASTVIDAPIEEVFAFFSRAENLGALTPPDMQFAIASAQPIAMGPGATIDYQIKLGPIPLTWRTEIEQWTPAARFVDVQLAGPYKTWWHEHSFTKQGDRTVVEDHVLYALPLGILGRIAHRLWVRRKLQGIFAYRGAAIGHRFGAVADASSRTAA